MTTSECIRAWGDLSTHFDGVDISAVESAYEALVPDMTSKKGWEKFNVNKGGNFSEGKYVLDTINHSREITTIIPNAIQFIDNVVAALIGDNKKMVYRHYARRLDNYITTPYRPFSDIAFHYSYPSSNPVITTVRKQKYNVIREADEAVKELYKFKFTNGWYSQVVKDTLELLKDMQADENVSMEVIERYLRHKGVLLAPEWNTRNVVYEDSRRLNIKLNKPSYGKPQGKVEIKQLVREALTELNLDKIYDLKSVHVWRGDRQAPQPNASLMIIKEGGEV